MNKLVRRAIAAGAVVAALSTATVPSAMAAAGDGACTYTEVCGFKLKNYGGGMADLATSDPDWRNNYFTSGGNAHNSVSSGFAIERPIVYWNALSYAGRWFALGINEYDAHWSTNQAHTNWKSFDFDNAISSHYLLLP